MEGSLLRYVMVNQIDRASPQGLLLNAISSAVGKYTYLNSLPGTMLNYSMWNFLFDFQNNYMK